MRSRRSPTAVQPLHYTLSEAKSPMDIASALLHTSFIWLVCSSHVAVLAAAGILSPATIQAGNVNLQKTSVDKRLVLFHLSTDCYNFGSITNQDARTMSNTYFCYLQVVRTCPLTDLQGRLVLFHSLQCGAVKNYILATTSEKFPFALLGRQSDWTRCVW